MRYFHFYKAMRRSENAPVFDQELDKKFSAALKRASRAYDKHLDKIAGRLGSQAHRFFRFGFADTGLHDGLIVNFSIGDGVGLTEKQIAHLRCGNEKSVVLMQALRDARLHTFEFKKLRKVVVDIPSDEPLWFREGRRIGEIDHYEIVAVSPKYLRCEWLLNSGGSLTIEFEKLSYRCKKL